MAWQGREKSASSSDDGCRAAYRDGGAVVRQGKTLIEGVERNGQHATAEGSHCRLSSIEHNQ